MSLSARNNLTAGTMGTMRCIIRTRNISKLLLDNIAGRKGITAALWVVPKLVPLWDMSTTVGEIFRGYKRMVVTSTTLTTTVANGGKAVPVCQTIKCTEVTKIGVIRTVDKKLPAVHRELLIEVIRPVRVAVTTARMGGTVIMPPAVQV